MKAAASVPERWGKMLYADNPVLVCRQQHPALSEPLTIENLRNYDHSSFMTEGQSNHALRQRIDEIFPERQISFSSYNMFTTASLIGSSDMLCVMPSRLYSLLQKCWPLESIPLSQLNAESIEISLHYNKLSLRDPVPKTSSALSVRPSDRFSQHKSLQPAGQKGTKQQLFYKLAIWQAALTTVSMIYCLSFVQK